MPLTPLPKAEPGDLSGHEYLQPILLTTGYVWRPSPRSTKPFLFPSAGMLQKRQARSNLVPNGAGGRIWDHLPTEEPDFGLIGEPTVVLEIPPEQPGRGKLYKPAAFLTETFHTAEQMNEAIDAFLRYERADLTPFPEPTLMSLEIPTARPWTAKGRARWPKIHVHIIFRSDDALKVIKGINIFTDATRAKPVNQLAQQGASA